LSDILGLSANPSPIFLENTLFVWTSEHDKTFSTLKTSLVQAPVLALPNFDKPFALETDASDLAIGAVLMQERHSQAFLSKALGPKSKGLSSYEKEYMAILIVVQQWHLSPTTRFYHLHGL
jgi:hypothetical protein